MRIILRSEKEIQRGKNLLSELTKKMKKERSNEERMKKERKIEKEEERKNECRK